MASERKFVTEKIRRVLLKEYVMSRVSRAGFGGLDVQRTPMGTRVTLVTERPGLVIGRRGEAIKSLTQAIEDDFSFSNPQIEVQEVDNPNLNAQIMAEKLASALERGWHFRRAGHSTVRRIMESGARGCQVTVAGKLTGQRHRREKFKNGHIKFCGQAKLDFMERGFANARLKPGVIGVTVQIMHPEARLPDEIDIIPPPEPAAVPAKPEAVPETVSEEDAEKAVEERAAEAVEELKKKSSDGDEKAKKAPVKAKKKESDGEEKKPRKRKKKAEKDEESAAEEKPEGDDKPAPEKAAEGDKKEAAKPAPPEAPKTVEEKKPAPPEEEPVPEKPAEEEPKPQAEDAAEKKEAPATEEPSEKKAVEEPKEE